MLSFLSASTFYPFCLHPHFIPLVRILSLLSASYPFCLHLHVIPFVHIHILLFLSACPSVSVFYPNPIGYYIIWNILNLTNFFKYG
jgi:hypothetical protein